MVQYSDFREYGIVTEASPAYIRLRYRKERHNRIWKSTKTAPLPPTMPRGE
jgi:hypothetical protein